MTEGAGQVADFTGARLQRLGSRPDTVVFNFQDCLSSNAAGHRPSQPTIYALAVAAPETLTANVVRLAGQPLKGFLPPFEGLLPPFAGEPPQRWGSKHIGGTMQKYLSGQFVRP